MSEIFWERVNNIIENYRHTLDLREELLKNSVQIYEIMIRKENFSLERRERLISWIKIKICRSGRHSSVQRSIFLERTQYTAYFSGC